MHPGRDKFKAGDFIYFLNHERELYILKALEITDEGVLVERITPDLSEGDSLRTRYSHQSMGMISGEAIPEDQIPFLKILFKK